MKISKGDFNKRFVILAGRQECFNRGTATELIYFGRFDFTKQSNLFDKDLRSHG